MLIFLISLVAVTGMVILGKEDRGVLIYEAMILLSILLYCITFKWTNTGGRLQLTFFFMFGPVVAVFLDKYEKYQVEGILAAILLVCAIPWIFQTQERPFVVNPERTITASVLKGDRTELYFATNPEDYEPYQAMTAEIRAQGISEVGLELTDHSEEYPLWVLLGAPDADLRMEWVVADNPSHKYLDPDFQPGAIICEDCSEQEIATYGEGYQRLNFGDFDLFLKTAD
jgi:hypothetical protein